jgi:hypothetical protein
MRLEQVYDHCRQYVKHLNKKGIEFANGIVAVLADEEMKIRREETDKQIETLNQHGESRGAFEG